MAKSDYPRHLTPSVSLWNFTVRSRLNSFQYRIKCNLFSALSTFFGTINLYRFASIVYFYNNYCLLAYFSVVTWFANYIFILKCHFTVCFTCLCYLIRCNAFDLVLGCRLPIFMCKKGAPFTQTILVWEMSLLPY